MSDHELNEIEKRLRRIEEIIEAAIASTDVDWRTQRAARIAAREEFGAVDALAQRVEALEAKVLREGA